MLAYLKLIDDTLAYIQKLLPSKQENPPPPILEKPKPLLKPAPPKPTPSPKKIEKKEIPLKLQPPTAAPTSHNKMERLLKSIAPNLYLHLTPLSDEKAKRIKNAWSEKSQIPEIPILFQGTDYSSFLHHLAKAITLCFHSARALDITPFEKEKKWDLFFQSPKLRLILCPDHLIFSSKELLPFYRESPSQKTRFLGEIPLLLLPDLSLYYKDPYLKRSLWNVICQALS